MPAWLTITYRTVLFGKEIGRSLDYIILRGMKDIKIITDRHEIDRTLTCYLISSHVVPRKLIFYLVILAGLLSGKRAKVHLLLALLAPF